MAQMFYHEERYRDHGLMARLRSARITVCGAGALGANLVENLVRAGAAAVTVIDRDRVEERNLSTQPWQRTDIGRQKAVSLADSLYRAVGVEVNAVARELTADNAARLLHDGEMVVEVFDNSRSRQLVADHCRGAGLPCLHAGMAADYSELIWNEEYVVPSPANDDVCDYPLARTLAVVTAALAAELVIRYIADGARNSYTFTIGDFAVRPYGG